MKTWWRISLLNFLIAGVIGVILRYAFVEELSWMNYRYFLHAHSHLAMLGWVYLALYTFLIPAFLYEGQAQQPRYRRLFWLTQLSVIGMLFSFPLQGYGPVSITFSTVHTLLSFVFAYYFLKDLDSRSISSLFVRAAIGFMLFSTIGLWAMAIVMVGDGRGTVWYYLSVQFYLHFQFYGWFTLALFALCFRWMERRNIPIATGPGKVLLQLLIVSVLLTFALTLTWAFPGLHFFIINGMGVVLQLAALYFLFHIFWPYRRQILALLPRWSGKLIAFSFFAWALKALIQGLTLVPIMASIGYTIRNFTIGFLHLFLLGVMSTFLIGYAFTVPALPTWGRPAILGAGIFLSGIILSEAILFLQGFMLWGGMGFMPGYYELLFGISILLPAGIFLIWMDKGQLNNHSISE